MYRRNDGIGSVFTRRPLRGDSTRLGPCDRLLRIVLVSALMMAIQGCTTVRRFMRPEQYSFARLAGLYQQTTLGKTSSLTVLRSAQSDANDEQADLSSDQMVAETDNVVAVFGQSPDRYAHWFSLFSFDPYDMTVRNKYFFLFDEKAMASPLSQKRYLTPHQVLLFEAELRMGKVLKQPFTTVLAQRVSLVQEATRRLRHDVGVVTTSAEGPTRHYRELASNGAFANQILEEAVRRLNQSPVLARKLALDQGVAFSSVSLGKGRIWMDIHQDVVHLAVDVGL